MLRSSRASPVLRYGPTVFGTADFVTELERRLGRPIAPSRSRAEGCAGLRGQAVRPAAIGKLSPYLAQGRHHFAVRFDGALSSHSSNRQ